jgi:thioredoxin-like negative regulator of GroEL
VDGLEAEYGEQINFVRLNVEIPENERIQQGYGLRGHPSVAILDADGVMVQGVFGAETAVNLRTYLDQIVP